MKNLIIEVYTSKNAKQPQKTITLPLSTLEIGLRFLPLEIKSILEKEGMDLGYSQALIKDKDIKGPLIEVENTHERLIISAE